MASCAVMGVDWRSLTLADFWTLTEGWNAQHSDEKPDLDRLKRFREAHRE